MPCINVLSIGVEKGKFSLTGSDLPFTGHLSFCFIGIGKNFPPHWFGSCGNFNSVVPGVEKSLK